MGPVRQDFNEGQLRHDSCRMQSVGTTSFRFAESRFLIFNQRTQLVRRKASHYGKADNFGL